MLPTLIRRQLREERLPDAALWVAASEGTAYWLALVARGLRTELGGPVHARALLARAASTAYSQRYRQLRARLPELPALSSDPNAPAPVISALYPGPLFRTIDRWLLEHLGGPVRGLTARRKSRAAIARLSMGERWHETTTHLGALLVAITAELSRAGVPRANALLGSICEEFGVWTGQLLKRLLLLPTTPEAALELLRMGEYIFRVNPIHDTVSNNQAGTGHLVGNACPWVHRPGWSAMHCGIFGRFQAGCVSAFGLRYALTTTIPRHGGELCRIDVAPIQLRTAPGARAIDSHR